MTNSNTMLYAAGAFILGVLIALAGEHFLGRQKDQRDDMQTIGSFQDWRMTCSPRTTKKGICIMQHTVVPPGSNSPVAQLTVVSKDKGDVIQIAAPLGILIPPGLRFTVGSTVTKTAAFDTCVQAGCVAVIPIDDSMAAAMSKSAGGQISIARLDGKVVALNYSLRGYNDAFAARAVDVAARK
jgi:invasion protein IalB